MSRVIVPGDGDERHGTRNGYVNLGCRCTDCRRANAVGVAKRRTERRRSNIPVPHGTENGYMNYRCRCDACRVAHRTYSQGLRGRRAEATHTHP